MIGKTFLRLERDFDKHVIYCRDEPIAQEFLNERKDVREFFQVSKKTCKLKKKQTNPVLKINTNFESKISIINNLRTTFTKFLWKICEWLTIKIAEVGTNSIIANVR